MTALKKTVRTRRGVEPAGRPARREVELGKKSTNELVQEVRRGEGQIIGFFKPSQAAAKPNNSPQNAR